MLENYFRGVFAAYLGTGFLNGPVSEWQIDMIKENISRFHETLIDHSCLTALVKTKAGKGFASFYGQWVK